MNQSVRLDAAKRVIFENLLVLNAGDAGIAFDKATGKVVWKSAAQECAYSTPLPLRRGDESEAHHGGSDR